MGRKAKNGKQLTANELTGIMSDTIRNLKNGTVNIDEANAISQATRTYCGVVKTQMQVCMFQKNNPCIDMGS